jgi:hypothetical protein
MHTDQLIHQLADQMTPVRRLLTPWRRTSVWLLISILYVGVVAGAWLQVGHMSVRIEPTLLVELAAILATAVTASLAAFSSVVPGTEGRLQWLPVIPLSIWLGCLGNGCVHDWLLHGEAGLRMRSDADCVAPALLLSIPLTIAMVAMLRSGAPLVPRVSFALGALAVAALASLGLRLFHAGDLSVQILAWHLGGAAVFTAVGCIMGRGLFNWVQVVRERARLRPSPLRPREQNP